MAGWHWVVVFAVCGLLITAATYWNRCDDSRTYRAAWAQSAASTDDDAQIADERARFDQIIAAEFPAGIPHQRRKEDPQ